MIYLVRHGQSTWNRDRLLQGQTAHPPLTDLGRHQAVIAAELISSDSRSIELFVSSDQVRARQTAEVLAGDRPVALDRRLRERHAGRLQGLTTDAGLAAVQDFDWNDPEARLGDEGESAHEVHARIGAVLAEHSGLDEHYDRDVVLVSHGDTIRAALGWWCGFAPATEPWVDVASAAVFALDEPGRFRLIAGTVPPG